MSMLVAAALIFSSSDSTPAPSPVPADHAAMDHSTMAPTSVEASAAGQAMTPKEPGQSAYAALSETVRILLADPKTNWSNVDVDTLRGHLVDMDNVTLRSRVATTSLPNGARFAVSGTGDTVGAIQRMTKSHFAMDDAKNGWSVAIRNVADGAIVTVISANSTEVRKIGGLGFFGVLTMGAHHQPHHLMMAQGAMGH